MSNLKDSACMLAELMVKRRFKDTQLPFKFWNDPRFRKIYIREMQLAYGLLKLYNVEIICKALNTKEGSKIYSLCAKWLDPLLQIEKKKIEVKEALKEMKIQEVQGGELPKLEITGQETEPLTLIGCRHNNKNPEPPGKQSLASKLKGL